MTGIPRERSTSCDRCYGDAKRGCEAGHVFGPCKHPEVCEGRCQYEAPCECPCHTTPITRSVILAPRDIDIMRLQADGAGAITQVAAGLYLQALHQLQGSTTERLPADHRIHIEVTLIPPDSQARTIAGIARRAAMRVVRPGTPPEHHPST